MLKNYLRVAVRNLVKSKGFSFLNIAGLGIGMGASLLIILWLTNEWNYDRFYPKGDRIYSAWNEDYWGKTFTCWSVTPQVFQPAIKQEYPEVEAATRYDWDNSHLFGIGDKKVQINGNYADPDFLYMFDVPFMEGNPKTAMHDPYSILLTQSSAKTLFGNVDPMGKRVRVDNRDNLTVTAVLKDPPTNTSFNFKYLLPWAYREARHETDTSWGDNSTRNFVLLKAGTNVTAFNNKISTFIKRHSSPDQTEHQFVYPLTRMHLYGNFVNGKPAGGRITTVRTFGLIALFILLIACINFMNLATARSEKRAREVGIRKTVGALRGSLISQFLAESILLAATSGVLALLLVRLTLPSFDRLTQLQLDMPWNNPMFWVAFLGFILFTGVLAGSYPAFYLSSFRPTAVLKGTFRNVRAKATLRSVLVVAQFTIAIALIICTLIVRLQIRYAQNREAGYNRQDLGYIYMNGDIGKHYDAIRNELLNEGIVTSLSKCSYPLTQSWSNTWGITWDGKKPDDKTIINVFCTDGNLVKTAGMHLVQGRDIDLVNFPGDSMSVVLNEAAAKAMEFKNPIGQILRYDTTYKVIGVVKDFIMESPYEPIRPIALFGPKEQFFNVITMKLSHQRSTKENLAAMEKIFKQYNPDYPFSYSFLDQEYAQKFSDQETVSVLVALFAGLTIFISCLGLFGLAAYMAETRVKEIGIRKVLGASVLSITTLLSRNFVALVVFAILISSPLAGWFMYEWLMGFNYHVPFDGTIWIFLGSGFMAILIALATVSYQAIRAAVAKPIKSLRTE